MAHPAATRSGARLPWRWLARILATVAILALLAWWLPFDELVSAMGAVPAATWPLAVGVYLAAHLLGVVKWRGLVNAAGAGLRARQAGHAYYWGLFGNLFLPSLVGGDVVRAGVAMRQARSKSAIVLGSLVDRVQDVIGLGVIAGAGALLAPRALDEASRQIFVVFLSLMAAGGVAAVLVLRFFPARLAPFKVRRLLVRVRQALRSTASRPSALVVAFALGLALQTALILLNWELGRLIGIEIPLHVWFFVWPLAKIASLLPVTQGGIGVREAAQAALFAPFGVGAVQAVATGLVFEVVIITGGLLSGGIALVLRRGPAGREAGPASAPSVTGTTR
ncbi:MAG TPA: lysylphosphatidylglycerol synthase transmembrane domain-containing protein [Gemmatimonadaceae bacterium]